MMAATSALGKTPVSILQELLSRRGSTPKYELVQIEGAIHEPTFRYRVTVVDVVAMGTGRSKKEAKHAAAKAILDKLIIGINGTEEEEPSSDGPKNNSLEAMEQIESILSGMHINRADAASPPEDKIEGNPIGTLQELCMSRRWPPPNYEMMSEEGLPHERLFTIGCTVFKYKETGIGKSKKLAKRQAAHKMWEKLKDFPAVGQTLDIEENDEMSPSGSGAAAAPSMSARYADLKSSKISILSNPHSHKVSLFHKNLKHSTGAKLGQLQTTSMSDKEFDAVTFLHDISTEQQFEVTYVDIEERSLKGKMQCLVQLSTLPVAVCYGYGESSKLAQASAARNALEYLKIMTKT